jgi:flagellar secretion chaperone FliS
MWGVADTSSFTPARGYLEGRAHSAEPLDVVHTLYRVALESVGGAIAHLHDGDTMARSRDVTRAEEAVHELVLALDKSVDAPFVRTLADLYTYILERLVQGHSQQSEQAFRDAQTILVTLESAWAGVRAKVNEEAAPVAVDSSVEEPAAQQQVHDASTAYEQFSVPASSRDWSA